MLVRHPRGIAILLMLLAMGCGSDSTGPDENPEPTYESIAGTYAGVMAGVSQGVTLEGTFSITIQQAAGDLSGSWSMTGTLDDGVVTVPVQGTGSLSGTVGSGTNPSVNFTVGSGLCPNLSEVFSGSYDSANRRITVSGPITILDGCDPFLVYNGTFVLSR